MVVYLKRETCNMRRCNVLVKGWKFGLWYNTTINKFCSCTPKSRTTCGWCREPKVWLGLSLFFISRFLLGEFAIIQWCLARIDRIHALFFHIDQVALCPQYLHLLRGLWCYWAYYKRSHRGMSIGTHIAPLMLWNVLTNAQRLMMIGNTSPGNRSVEHLDQECTVASSFCFWMVQVRGK